MPHSIFVDGAAGTTGLEILERLQGRDEFQVIEIDAGLRKDENVRREALNDADIAILCLPDDAARSAMDLLDPGAGTRVIDASSAHRTAEGWCYGFPELVGSERVADARRVSNPGCYPTGFLALVAPLVRKGLLPADWPYTVHAVSGYSGGGKALIERFEGDSTIGFRAYGLAMGHKHLPEMQTHATLGHPPLFSPAVVDAYRGMIVEVPLPLGQMGERAAPAEHLLTGLRQAYDSCPVIGFPDPPTGELLLRKDSPAWDGLELFIYTSDDESQIRLVARLDNLGKGASGAAIQNLNLMCGLPETAGLRLGAA